MRRIWFKCLALRETFNIFGCEIRVINSFHSSQSIFIKFRTNDENFVNILKYACDNIM